MIEVAIAAPKSLSHSYRTLISGIEYAVRRIAIDPRPYNPGLRPRRDL